MLNDRDPLSVAYRAQRTADKALTEARAASGMLAILCLLMFIMLAAIGLAAVFPR